MKKMIMFTSLITTLTAAGTVLAMTGSPVKAADEHGKTSEAMLEILDVAENLELKSVPTFDYGTISTGKLADTFNKDVSGSHQLKIHHSTTKTSNDYTGWQLSAKVNEFKLNGTGQALDVAGKLQLSDTDDDILSTDQDNLPAALTVGNANFTTVASRANSAGNPDRFDFETTAVAGELTIKANTILGLEAGQKYQSTINWHLGLNGSTPTELP